MQRDQRDRAITELEAQLAALREQASAEELLEAVWNELGPYTEHLSTELRYKLQDYFKFDDSE